MLDIFERNLDESSKGTFFYVHVKDLPPTY